ncbi:MAG: IclR family transcriptional regulator [Gemmatimonas sp.]
MSAKPADPPMKLVRIVDRAARILECFGRATPELSLPQISSRLRLPKPTAFRILTNLVRHGLLQHNPATATYTLGFATLRLADDLLQSLDIRAHARPVMQAIRDAVNESVVLSVRRGDFRYNIDTVESTHAIGQTQQIGTPVPLYAGAASRALLAAMTDEEVRSYLARTKLVPFQKTTLVDADKIREDIARTRRRGYVVTSAEYTPGGHAVGCAIVDAAGHGVAALHVSIPNARFSKAAEDICAKNVVEGARRIAAALAENRSGGQRSV